VLLAADYDDDWLDNPVVAGTWGLTWAFKEAFDDAFEVLSLSRAGAGGVTGRGGVDVCSRRCAAVRNCTRPSIASQSYAAGHWSEARPQLQALLHARTTAEGCVLEDSPCRTLLGFMEGHGFVPPPDWRGVRELTEK
jgi:hypothetical protein